MPRSEHSNSPCPHAAKIKVLERERDQFIALLAALGPSAAKQSRALRPAVTWFNPYGLTDMPTTSPIRKQRLTIARAEVLPLDTYGLHEKTDEKKHLAKKAKTAPGQGPDTYGLHV